MGISFAPIKVRGLTLPRLADVYQSEFLTGIQLVLHLLGSDFIFHVFGTADSFAN
jgi:hypothetical protein